jgi:hypothetical protein
MPTYEITDTETDRTVVVEGPSPPTEQEAADIFANLEEEPTEQYGGFVEEAVGLGEVALQVGTGALLEPVAGFAGLLEEDLNEREQAVQDVRARAFEPRTPIGRRTSKAVGEAMLVVEEKVDRFAEAISFGNPAVATIVRTAIMGVPAALGLKGGITGKVKSHSDIKKIDQAASELGIDLGSPEITQQIVTAGGEKVPIPVKGAALENLQAELKAKRDAVKADLDTQFEQARNTQASLRSESLAEYGSNARQFLDDQGYDIEMMPIVNKRLAEIAEFEQFPNTSAKLNWIQKFRKRLNKSRPPKTDASQNAALNIMKSRLDKWLDDQFTQDMIIGDPEALNAWKQAIESFKTYKENFSDNKVIHQLVSKDTTVEQVRRWVLGASSVGAKAEAALVVKKLKKVLGEDSPQITALRQEYLFDIIDPLLERTPNFTKFIKNYDSAVKNNWELVQELAPFAESGLDDLVKIANTAIKTGKLSKKLEVDLDRGIAVVSFGHDIARKGYIVANAKNILRAIREGLFGTSQRKLILRELL